MPVPEWEFGGVLPPFIENDFSPIAWSPYPVAVSDVAARFGDTVERRRLLTGLLDYRAELRRAGLVSGFQWIDGSFVENIEGVEGRAPRDIDVVNFYRLPDAHSEETLLDAFPDLFHRAGMKERYAVDAYHVPLEQERSEDLVAYCVYWHGLWSHRRDRLWKGYLRVDLSSEDDDAARQALDERAAEGGRI